MSIGQNIINDLNHKSLAFGDTLGSAYPATDNVKASALASIASMFIVDGDRAVFVDKRWVDLYNTPDQARYDLQTYWAPRGVTLGITADELTQEVTDMATSGLLEPSEAEALVDAVSPSDIPDHLILRIFARTLLGAGDSYEDESVEWWTIEEPLPPQDSPLRPIEMF